MLVTRDNLSTSGIRQRKESGDGKKYILCELNEPFPPHRRKQLVLHLIHFRLEDFQKDSENPTKSPSSEPKRVAPKSAGNKPATANS
jgi:hypothetical protein